MIHNTVNINVDYEAMGVEPSPRQTTLTTYILDKETINTCCGQLRPAIIVCPGGGYEFTSVREAEPIALRYNAEGFHAFVLDYSIIPTGYPAAVCELSKAVAYVKSIADDNMIDKNRIFVAGFSAGGHLAASLGVHGSRPEVLKYSGLSEGENVPAGIILGYPVITAEDGKTHDGTIQGFVAGRDDIYPLASLENFVTEKTPKMFIWHTFTDKTVPVISSLRLAAALEKNGVEFELHIYPMGDHGLSLGNEVTANRPGAVVEEIQNWAEMSVRWIKQH